MVMKEYPNLVVGDQHIDARGKISFINDFDMLAVRRMYMLTYDSPSTTRGWRAHRREQRWFTALNGSFRISTVEIDDWVKPSKALPMLTFNLEEAHLKVLHVPPGFGTFIEALEPNSKILVYGDYLIDQAANDYNTPLNQDHLFS